LTEYIIIVAYVVSVTWRLGGKKILIRLVCISNRQFVRCTNHAILLVYV